MKVSMCYFAAAEAAVGVSAEELDVQEGARLSDLVEAISAKHPERDAAEIKRVIGLCSFLVNGKRADDADLDAGARIDVLPPFAGG